jgi:hypothetical protein
MGVVDWLLVASIAAMALLCLTLAAIGMAQLVSLRVTAARLRRRRLTET